MICFDNSLKRDFDMNKFIIAGAIFTVLISAPPAMASFFKSPSEKVLEHFKKLRDDQLILDLMQGKFIPPYESTDSLVDTARLCKQEFFDKDRVSKEYAMIMARSEYLGIPSKKTAGLVDDLFTNSGGLSALYDYISGDIVYLFKARNRKQAEQVAAEMFNAYMDSPQVKKLEKQISLLEDESTEIEKRKTMQAVALCGVFDVYYVVFGGVEYSVSIDSLRGIKRQIHSGVMGKTMSDLEALMNE
jgi:hypothetical protein